MRSQSVARNSAFTSTDKYFELRSRAQINSKTSSNVLFASKLSCAELLANISTITWSHSKPYNIFLTNLKSTLCVEQNWIVKRWERQMVHCIRQHCRLNICSNIGWIDKYSICQFNQCNYKYWGGSAVYTVCHCRTHLKISRIQRLYRLFKALQKLYIIHVSNHYLPG